MLVRSGGLHSPSAPQVVSQNSEILSPIAVDAVLRVIDPATATNVDLRDIKVITKKGGTIDDTKLIDGILFNQKASHTAGGPTKITNAKIGLVQFCLSAPKTDVRLPRAPHRLLLLLLLQGHCSASTLMTTATLGISLTTR